MSGVWGWFGGQSAQKRKDTPKNAILGLRSQLEMLQKRERHLQNQMDEQDAIARKNVSTNKNGTYSHPFVNMSSRRNILFHAPFPPEKNNQADDGLLYNNVANHLP
jgi:hypothetical protein